MGDVIGIILIIVVVAALAVAAYAYVTKRRNTEQAQGQLQQRSQPADPFAPNRDTGGDPRQIRAGDMLEFGGEKFFVRGSLRIAEGGYTWSEHFYQADTSAQRRWLTVEEDPDLQVSIWQDRPDLELDPRAKRLEVDGVTFDLVEHGTASYRAEGTTGLQDHGALDYVDFESGDGRQLSLERFDHGQWEASTGESVAVGAITIYPGS